MAEVLNSRLQALIDRGYTKEDVLRLSSCTIDEFNEAAHTIFSRITANVTKNKQPFCLFIGGQPGSGKTCLSMEIKELMNNAIEIGIDNYRTYHPHYLEMEKLIKEHWVNRKETVNDSPGNDIADFTHLFSGAMTDKLIEEAARKDEFGNSYNILLEWGMREPTGPLKTMADLKTKDYQNIVVFVCTHKDTSLLACEVRANIMGNDNHIIRKVPQSFHNLCIEQLPESINKIYEYGISNKIIDDFKLCLRSGKIIWDNTCQGLPGNIFNSYLNNFELTKEYINSDLLAFKTDVKEKQGLVDQVKILEKNKQRIIYTVNEDLLNSFYDQEYIKQCVK